MHRETWTHRNMHTHEYAHTQIPTHMNTHIWIHTWTYTVTQKENSLPTLPRPCLESSSSPILLINFKMTLPFLSSASDPGMKLETAWEGFASDLFLCHYNIDRRANNSPFAQKKRRPWEASSTEPQAVFRRGLQAGREKVGSPLGMEAKCLADGKCSVTTQARASSKT